MIVTIVCLPAIRMYNRIQVSQCSCLMRRPRTTPYWVVRVKRVVMATKSLVSVTSALLELTKKLETPFYSYVALVMVSPGDRLHFVLTWLTAHCCCNTIVEHS